MIEREPKKEQKQESDVSLTSASSREVSSTFLKERRKAPLTAAVVSLPTLLIEGKRAESISRSPNGDLAPVSSQSSADQEARKAKMTAEGAELSWRRKGDEGERWAAMEREQQRGMRAILPSSHNMAQMNATFTTPPLPLISFFLICFS